jgi:hypothetical protein
VQNDRIFMSHAHTLEDGFPNLEEIEETKQSQSRPSLGSSAVMESLAPVVRREVGLFKLCWNALIVLGN